MKPLGTGDPLRLGPYRVLGVLGSGGMGQVYLAREAGGRPVAVKVLRPELAHDLDLARRFVREARTASAVPGTGVAKVLDARVEGGRPWIATDFLAGPTLDDAVERHGPFDEAAAGALGAALVRTLAEIHGAGLVHRDLKPSNIVLTSDGPKIIDFGIARPEHGLTLTATGETVATPGYAPPEQVLGRRTGPAGDVFSLGAVLAFAVTGRRVFDGGHIAAVQYSVVHEEPELSTVPDGLRAVVAACLAKDAAARPSLDLLGRALAREPARAAGARRRMRPPWATGPLAQDIAHREADAARWAAGFPGDQPPPPSRRRLVRALAAGGAVLTVGGTAAWWLLRDKDAAAAPPSWGAKPLRSYDQGTAPQPLWGPVQAAEGDPPTPLTVRDLVVVAVRGGALRAYDVRDGQRRWTAPAAAVAVGALSAGDETILTADGSGALLALRAEDGGRRWSVRDADAAALLAADADAVYLVTRGGALRAIGLASRRPLWTVPSPVETSGPAPAAAVADGHLVVYGADGRAAALGTERGEVRWGPRVVGRRALPPAIADGTVYLGGKSLVALELANGEQRWAHPSTAPAMGWGPPVVQGKLLYAVDGSNLYARDRRDGADAWTLPVDSDTRTPPSQAPVVEGNSVWVVTTRAGLSGVMTADTRGGTSAWTTTLGDEVPWRLAAAGNRVFLQHRGTLTAMPVF
ncbi:serine/threonine-protein kinase [Streptomyces sp. XD-27]|uniref:serine/threonine-protein kinase n=1 Tax=Streptomyces sp. XD-27 TaxID=3062779 RepID=UPI0026F45773|nr:serine/threonine-protein kinase [Streptomyces sp. XD-27]WKX72922.1 serine/threonine-protein kinase [Streptomyces sp. XD-27]